MAKRRVKRSVGKPAAKSTVVQPKSAGPYLLPCTQDWEPSRKLELRPSDNPAKAATLGDIGVATEISSDREFPPTILIQPFDPRRIVGIDPVSVRMFRWNEKLGALRPVWSSGVNLSAGHVWAKVQRPGVYVPIGLPRDKVLQSAIQMIALQRQYMDPESARDVRALADVTFELFFKTPDEDLELLRQLMANVEIQSSVRSVPYHDLVIGNGGHVMGFALPGGASLQQFRERLKGLKVPSAGLPEEALFFRPELGGEGVPLLMLPGDAGPLPGLGPFPGGRLPGGPPAGDWGFPGGWEPGDDICPPLPDWWPKFYWPFPIEWPRFPKPFWPPFPFPFCKLFSRNWPMYHHDRQHTGVASGCSRITSTTVGTLTEFPSTTVEGEIVTVPTIVNGKIYIGTTNIPGAGPGGKLYKISLTTGAIENEFAVARRTPTYRQGIGGSPAVVGGRIFFTAIPGRVYCIDAATFALLWMTDLRDPDPLHNQPVKNNLGVGYKADSWSSPLVVNGKVYVGSGEGEDPSTYGFVFCLDANTGNVIWLFCTNKFVNPDTPGSENAPNVIPPEVAMSNPLPPWAIAAGFSIHPNPVPETGSSVWSSCAYDSTTNRIFVGTGNSEYAPGFVGTTVPDQRYGSGLLALDADTGAFAGFLAPATTDSYRANDEDIDVPGSPTVFSRGGQRVVAFGSKNGSFWLLRTDTLAVLARRQLLPRVGGSGLPGDMGTPHPNVDPRFSVPPEHAENKWGVMATPAVHAGTGRLFVGLGGYAGIHGPTTPFLRVLDWMTLDDDWPFAVGGDNVRRYTVGAPPLYGSSQPGLSSPALVNDVVFVSVCIPAALHAFDVATGNHLWSAGATGDWALGPAIYGNYVVMGAGSTLRRYCL